MIWALPLVAALVMCGLVVAPFVSNRADRVFTRVSLLVFGRYVTGTHSRKDRQRSAMRAAYADDVYRLFASEILLQATLLGLAGSILGVYLFAGLFRVVSVGSDALVEILPEELAVLGGIATVTDVSPVALFGLLLLSSATVGTALGAGMYFLRWKTLTQRATVRSSAIDETLPRTVAFLYALSRSGMSFPTIMRTLTDNEAVYGEAARELSIAVRDINTFGTDSLTALRRVSESTPSENMAGFTENLASVLDSGRPLSAFLEAQHERFQEESESRQEQYLELLSTFAEAYVTVLVAGPLFIITILVIIGLVLSDTIPILQVIVYAGLPLASAAFAVYVDTATRDRNTSVSGTSTETGTAGEPSDSSVTDGGELIRPENPTSRRAANRGRLRAYDRFGVLLARLKQPLSSLLRRPERTFSVTVPAGLLWVGVSVWPVSADPLEWPAIVDSPVVEATIVALGIYTLFHEANERRVESVEAAVPDFLDRLASLNEAGMTVVESFKQVVDTDLDALSVELDRTWRDISWGADVETALNRLDRRAEVPAVSRAIALTTNAMEASGDIGPVLRIAAAEARATRRLQRERKQVMFSYLIVIYISFLVFLGIVAALSVSFVPVIESAGIGTSAGAGSASVSGTASGGSVSGIGDVNAGMYETILFHATGVQAMCSGLIAGQLGEGTLRDGSKHAVVLLILSYAGFLAMGSL